MIVISTPLSISSSVRDIERLLRESPPFLRAGRMSIIDAFFFSIETLATVGYGTMVPATRYGHEISAIEIISGIVYTAVVAGVIFIRFSKPKAKIVYAERPVVANHNGVPTLMIRIANGRTSADIRRISMIEPDLPASRSAGAGGEKPSA